MLMSSQLQPYRRLGLFDAGRAFLLKIAGICRNNVKKVLGRVDTNRDRPGEVTE